MGPDKKRLSKRHGATSVTEYQRLGYLPEAMVNFLALLGWSPGGDREVLSRDELKQLFTLEGISGGNAVFNAEKLDWFNQQHIGRLPGDDLLRRIEGRLRDAGLWRDALDSDESAWIVKRPRAAEAARADVRPARRGAPAVSRRSAGDRSRGGGEASDAGDPAAARRSSPRRWSGWSRSIAATVEQALRATAEQAGVKAAALIHATRVAVTGRAVSAGLFELLVLLSRDTVVERLDRAANYTPQA